MAERKPDVDLAALEALLVRVFGGPVSVARTESGSSTQVYRVRYGAEACYARIAEREEWSMAPEAEVHRRLTAAGARVPAVVHLERFDAALRRSVLVTTEIPGGPDEPATAAVFRSAGRELALVHGVAVDGFGFLDRTTGSPELRGEFRDFAGWIEPAPICRALTALGFSAARVSRAEPVLAEAPPSPVLVHGDFDPSHVYRSRGGAFTGFIDFGEARGADYAFDLASLQLVRWERGAEAYRELERGYAEVRPLPADHVRRVYAASVQQAAHRLMLWHRRDGADALTGWFPRWVAARLSALLDGERLLL